MVANYLQRCGVDIGENLQPGDVGNPKGYYEDVDILRFHQDLLAHFKLGTFPTGNLEISTQVPVEFRLRAQEILQRKANSPVWGWKDCRTSLLLPFWREMLPEANFLFLFRHPVSVVDSLLRRGTDPSIVRNPAIAFRSWRLHNKCMLDFYRGDRASCFLAEIDSLVHDPGPAFSALFTKLDVQVPVRDFDAVYSPPAFKESRSLRDIRLMVRFPLQTLRSLRLYRVLKGLSDWPRSGGPPTERLRSGQFAADESSESSASAALSRAKQQRIRATAKQGAL
jgi:hypothetical protein